jgi:amyloid beta precursor protein binding protein 1
MHSSTASYLALQGLYRTQFQQDLRDFRVGLSSILGQLGLPEDAVAASEIESFVKNTSGVDVIKGSSIASRRAVGGELKSNMGKVSLNSMAPQANSEDDNFGLDDWPVTYGIPLHLALLAADQVHASLGRWPGADASSYESDVQAVELALAELVHKASAGTAEMPDELKQCAQEV